MKAYSTILVALDLFGNSKQVLAKVAALAEPNVSSVHLLHVPFDPLYVPAGYLGTGAYSTTPPALEREFIKSEALDTIAKLIDQAGLTDINIEIEFGRTTNIIIARAKILEADLIIVGSHGRHGIGLLLGSTANGVLHQANCDVLAVRIQE